MVEQARKNLPGLVPKFVELVSNILRLRQEILLSKKKYPEMERELRSLLTPDFLERIPPAQVKELPRYLRAMLVRADRWSVNAVKDLEKTRQIAPFIQRYNRLISRKDLTSEQVEAVQKLQWLIEELKVSLYAQELGTAVPISIKRVERFLEENRI